MVGAVEQHREARQQLVREVRGRLLAAEVLPGSKKIEVPELDIAAARTMTRAAEEAIARCHLGYALITVVKRV